MLFGMEDSNHEPTVEASEEFKLPTSVEELEEMLKQAKEQERKRISKLYSMSMLHYINNGLAEPFGYAEMVAQKPDMPEPKKERLIRHIFEGLEETRDRVLKLAKANPTDIVTVGGFEVLDIGLHTPETDRQEQPPFTEEHK